MRARRARCGERSLSWRPSTRGSLEWPPTTDGSTPLDDRLAAWPLDDASAARWRAAELGGWAQVVASASAARLIGILDRAVEAGAFADAAAMDDGVARDLAERRRARLAMDLVVERRTLQVSDAFTAAGVRHLVFKGAAYAHLLEDDPAMRHYDDVDVVVPGIDFGAAVAVIESLGGRRLYPEPRPGFDARYGKGASFATPEHGAIDLHRLVATGWAGAALERAGLFEDLAHVELGGRAVPTMSPNRTALVTTVRVIVGDQTSSARALRDAARAWRRPEVDAALVVELAERTGLATALAAGLLQVQARLGVVFDAPIGPWAQAHRPTSRALDRLAPYTASGWSYLRQLLWQGRDLPTVRDRARFAHGILLPSQGSGRAPMAKRIRGGLAQLGGRR